MDKRKIDIISILATLIVCILFYALFLGGDLSAYRSLSRKRSSLEATIDKDRYTVETQKDKEADISNLEREIKGHKLFLLKEDKIPYFLDYVSSLARRHRIVITSIKPGEASADDLLTKTRFSAELKGGFPAVYNFLYHFEEDWRGVKVETLSIDKNPEDSSATVRLTVAVLSIDGFTDKAYASYSGAEELKSGIHLVEDTSQGESPLLMRNPFVNALYGRMGKALVKGEADPDTHIRKSDDKTRWPSRIADADKDIKVKGILLSGDYPMALMELRGGKTEDTVKVGDNIGDFIVTDINRMYVSLKSGEKVIHLSLE